MRLSHGWGVEVGMGRGDLTDAEGERLEPFLPVTSAAGTCGTGDRHTIPEKTDSRALRGGSWGGLPPGLDAQRYAKRNTIERAINKLKQFRRIATRYDKLARNYLASVCLAAALVWWI